MSSSNTSSLQPRIICISFSWLIAMVSTVNNSVLNWSVSVDIALYLNLVGRLSFFHHSPCYAFVVNGLYYVEMCFLHTHFDSVFSHGCWIASDAFLHLLIWWWYFFVFPFVDVVCHIDLNILNQYFSSPRFLVISVTWNLFPSPHF